METWQGDDDFELDDDFKDFLWQLHKWGEVIAAGSRP